MYDIQRLHSIEVGILENIHNACRQMDIRYVMLSGTLLGAIRHKGFIPWDDDIDIGMTRSDYEKFLKEGKHYLPNNLFIQHYSSEPDTGFPFIKVRDTNTIFIEAGSENRNICHGIFVDVFPFDRVPSKGLGPRIEYRRRKAFNLIVKCFNKDAITASHSKMKKMTGTAINRLYCSRVPISVFFAKEEERRKRLNQCGDDCYLLHQFIWNGTATNEELFDSTLYSFEGHEFYGPKNYDLILTKFFGPNYMELPPIEKRITHEPAMVDFGPTNSIT